MLVATCVLKIQLYGVHSLKDKRQVVKSLLTRLPRQFNVAVAEVDHQDIWRTSAICLATVGTDAAYLHSLLEKSVRWVEEQRPDIHIEQYEITFR
ncbi:MAG: DUF503 domain-containing protein [Anaerolineales bacterium]|nr:DUF503 domain-containing protein [Anaerolineales bacterium]MCB8951906.1 DUF503 domain-containing protein [Ardenticatenales bacterium]